MNYPRIYEMMSLDFTIVSTPALERCRHDFRLNSNSSRMITPWGDIVPLMRDPGTGFHLMVDHFRAKPVLERKFLVVTHARKRGQAFDCRFKLEDDGSTGSLGDGLDQGAENADD